MDQKYILDLQQKVISLLIKYGGNKPLNTLCKDSCSELSRLMGYWVLSDYPEAIVNILKGDKVLNSDRSHDIVCVGLNDTMTILDPSIWQFYPDSNEILIGTAQNVRDAILVASRKYGGKWSLSETLTKCDDYTTHELEKIISLNTE